MPLVSLFFSFLLGDFLLKAAPMLLLFVCSSFLQSAVDFKIRSSSEALDSSELKPHPMSKIVSQTVKNDHQD